MVIHQAKKHLIDFAIATDPEYQDTWFHEVLADILENSLKKVEEGQDVRIIIECPVQHGKSELATKKFSAWILGKHPDWPIIVGSYSDDLATKFGQETRDIMQSSAYQRIFNTRLRQDTQAKGHWMTIEGGEYIAAGAGSGITGKNFKCLAGGTLITTNKGEKKIEDLKVGDEVLSLGESFCYNRIIAIKKSITHKIYEITIGKNIIRATGEHRFYIHNKGYIAVEDLQVGDKGILLKAQEYPISSITIKNTKVEVYDIQVENTENFFANNILVHNCGLLDDIFKNREEAESQTIRNSRWDWFRSTFYTRQKGNTAIIIINSRWHTDDIIGRLKEQQKKSEAEGIEHYDRWEVIRFPAIATEDDQYSKKGEPLWPERFPLEKLKITANTIGPYEFASLFQAMPVTSESQEFKQEWIKTRSWKEVEALDTRKFATIDPGGKELENNYTGIVRNYVDRQNKWNFKAMRVHFDSKELINYVFTLHSEGFEKIGIEETVYLKAIKPFFDEECARRNKFPMMIPLKHFNRQKEVRIRGLIPRYSTGAIFHIENECKDLEDEMIVFPRGANDDTLDAAAMQNEIAEPPIDLIAELIREVELKKQREQLEEDFGL